MSDKPDIAPQDEPEIEKAEKTAQKTSYSKGEKLFDWLTYGGIAGIGTFLMTIPVAYWAKYGGGAPMFKNAAKALEKRGMAAAGAEDMLMTTALMQGGNIAVIPIKLMEDHKPGVVEHLNAKLGDQSGDASVDSDKKQTWGSLVKARVFLAWLPVYVSMRTASMVFPQQLKAFENWFAEHLVCRPFGQPTHTPGLPKIVENETKAFRYGRIGALDVFATAAAATLLYIGSRIFARSNARWHARDLPKDLKSKDADRDQIENATASAPENPKNFAQSVTPRGSFTESITNQKTAEPASSLQV
jgi:hypothetical protein